MPSDDVEPFHLEVHGDRARRSPGAVAGDALAGAGDGSDARGRPRQSCRHCARTGRIATTGGWPRSGSTPSGSSARRSTGSASTSCTLVRVTRHALPLVLTHGWPGSIIEFRDVIGPLNDAGFHCVVPSLPGYGWSDKPADDGLGRRADCPRLGDADGSSGLRPLRRPGQRLGHERERDARAARPGARRRHPPHAAARPTRSGHARRPHRLRTTRTGRHRRTARRTNPATRRCIAPARRRSATP